MWIIQTIISPDKRKASSSLIFYKVSVLWNYVTQSNELDPSIKMCIFFFRSANKNLYRLAAINNLPYITYKMYFDEFRVSRLVLKVHRATVGPDAVRKSIFKGGRRFQLAVKAKHPRWCHWLGRAWMFEALKSRFIWHLKKYRFLHLSVALALKS